MKKYKWLLPIIIIVVALLIVTIYNNSSAVGVVSNVKEEITNTNSHDKKDIKSTFKIIKKDFNTKDFADCKLMEMNYGKNKNTLEYEEYVKDEHNVDEAIVIEFTFKTGSKSPIVFNPNSDYSYTAEFIKKDGKWKKVNWGMG